MFPIVIAAFIAAVAPAQEVVEDVEIQEELYVQEDGSEELVYLDDEMVGEELADDVIVFDEE